jgi:hypothetical protein
LVSPVQCANAAPPIDVTGLPLMVEGIVTDPPLPVYPVMVIAVPSSVYTKSPKVSARRPGRQKRRVRHGRANLRLDLTPVVRARARMAANTTIPKPPNDGQAGRVRTEQKHPRASGELASGDRLYRE